MAEEISDAEAKASADEIKMVERTQHKALGNVHSEESEEPETPPPPPFPS